MKVSEAFVVEITTNEQFRNEVTSAFLSMAGFAVEFPNTLTVTPAPVERAPILTQQFTAQQCIDGDIEVYVFGSRHYENGNLCAEYRRGSYDITNISVVNAFGHVSWGGRSIWYSEFHPYFFGCPESYKEYRGEMNRDHQRNVQFALIEGCLKDDPFLWTAIQPRMVGKSTTDFPEYFFREIL